jgi:hypothetical protein
MERPLRKSPEKVESCRFGKLAIITLKFRLFNQKKRNYLPQGFPIFVGVTIPWIFLYLWGIDPFFISLLETAISVNPPDPAPLG